MSFDGAIARPPRCVLVNVTSGESMECLFNPTQLSEKLQVNWNRLAVPGLSHQVLQFQSTANRQLSGVEFYLDAFFAAEQPGDVNRTVQSPRSGRSTVRSTERSEVNILEFRAFLRALTVPPEGTEDVAATAPPRVLFIWPEVVTSECVVASVEFTYKQLAVDNTILVYAANVTFEEILDTRVTSEELRQLEV